jgi:hypothetical protein
MAFRDAINSFFNKLRSRLLNPKTSKSIKERNDAANKNWQLTKVYTNKTFKGCPSKDVIIFDLGYNNGKNFDEKETRKHITAFNKNKKRKELFHDVNGFILKPDFGMGKKYSAHLMILFDSTKRNYLVEIRLADKIVDFWAEATNGQGHVWLYNAKTGHNVNNWVSEIREVNSQDDVMLDRLLMLLEYWCKKEKFVSPALANLKQQSIQLGELPHAASKSVVAKSKSRSKVGSFGISDYGTQKQPQHQNSSQPLMPGQCYVASI